MRVDWTGHIEGGFYALGHPGVPVYLMEGEFPALFDAGFTGLAEVYLQAIKEVLGDRSPAYLFLTHAHWDHVGSAGIFKREWPDMKIVASRESRDLLAKPRVVETITRLNREALEALRSWGATSLYEGTFAPFAVDEVVTPEAPYRLDRDVSVVGRPSPGHTRDFTVYWIPERKILVASEAVGCNQVPEFLVDYDVYLRDIEAFMEMDIRVLCTGHRLVLTGEDVRLYLEEAWEIAENYRRRVEKYLEEGKDVDAIVEALKRWEWDPKPLPKQPLPTYLMNTRRRVQVLKERWEKGGSS